MDAHEGRAGLVGRSARVSFAASVPLLALMGWLHGCGSDAASNPSPEPVERSCGPSCDGNAGCDGACDGGTSDPLYPRYDGCEPPATTFTRTLIVDPATGRDDGDGSAAKPLKTLAAALGAKKIQPGDHVVLKPGDHGKVGASKYDNPQLQNGASWIWMEFQPGATAQQVAVSDMSRWLVTGATISSEKATLVAFSGGSNMILADSTLYTVKDATSWTANEWINTASDGISVRNTTCATVVRNRLSNLRFAVSVFTDDANPATNRMKALVERNDARRFSADGMRPNGSDITFRYNRFLDEYASEADGDANHDDGLQMFALNGAVYDNIVIEGNWFQETTNPARSFNASMQGISVFDGLITHLKVVDNVVLCSAYHGIAGYGIADGLIEHNTVANNSTNGNATWILVPPAKDNTAPKNDVVQNNVAVSFPGPQAGVTYTNDIVVATPTDVFTVFDRTQAKYDLTPKPGSVLDGKGAGSSLLTANDPRLLAY